MQISHNQERLLTIFLPKIGILINFIDIRLLHSLMIVTFCLYNYAQYRRILRAGEDVFKE